MMNLALTIFFVLFLISMLLLMISGMTWKMKKNREKSSPYECGIDPFNNARSPFSLRFFLLAILFLVFDVEIVLLVSIPKMSKKIPQWVSYPAILLILILLVWGLIHEWNEGSLEWNN